MFLSKNKSKPHDGVSQTIRNIVLLLACSISTNFMYPQDYTMVEYKDNYSPASGANPKK
ncbi:MAG: hypothetical protein NC453_24940 [Muribaculum sp.]|nr:hypothetical protein [Muribaculum sp.]